MKSLNDISIGADPELFCFDLTNNRFISAHTFLKGNKAEPFPVERGAVQVDGTAAEFNIQPSHDKAEFVSNICTVMHQLQQMIPNQIELRAVPFVQYRPDYFDELPYEARVSGCDPDYNAWLGGQVNPTPMVPSGLCAAGGHVHVGWTMGADVDDFIHKGLCHQVVRQLDCLLGLASFEWDEDMTRRQIYGKAGAFRYKDYGVEYRTLSNAWLQDTRIMERVYDLTMKAVNLLNQGVFLENYYGEQVPTIINSGDKTAALDLLTQIEQESYKHVS